MGANLCVYLLCGMGGFMRGWIARGTGAVTKYIFSFGGLWCIVDSSRGSYPAFGAFSFAP